jgi:hypothetical protein
MGGEQGCQMVCFQTKNPNLGKFWWVLLWKILVYFMTIWSLLRPLEIFYGHLVYFVVIWFIFPRFGILDQKNLATQVVRKKDKKIYLMRWNIGRACLFNPFDVNQVSMKKR